VLQQRPFPVRLRAALIIRIDLPAVDPLILQIRDVFTEDILVPGFLNISRNRGRQPDRMVFVGEEFMRPRCFRPPGSGGAVPPDQGGQLQYLLTGQSRVNGHDRFGVLGRVPVAPAAGPFVIKTRGTRP